MPENPPFRSDRADGRFRSTAGFVHHRLKHLRPALAFDEGLDRAGLEAWQAKVRRKLRRLLAFPKVPPQPEPVMVDAQPREGFELQTWELYPEPDCVVLFYLLVPEGVDRTKPAPAVMCFPGSQQPMEVLAGDPEPAEGPWRNKFGAHNWMAAHFARRGLVAMAMENPSTASSADAACPSSTRQSLQLIWMGRSYEGLSVFQKRAGYHWLRRQPFVDRKRIALCGHSLGAKPAVALGVLEREVAAVIWNDFAASWRQREVVRNLAGVPVWHYIPEFINWFDYPDLMAALAPRPLLVSEGSRYEDQDRIGRAYAIAGAEDAFKVTWMPNFDSPEKRTLVSEPMPEGLSAEEYARYAGYDGDHYFKDDVAVPWLCERLGV